METDQKNMLFLILAYIGIPAGPFSAGYLIYAYLYNNPTNESGLWLIPVLLICVWGFVSSIVIIRSHIKNRG